MSTIIEIDDLSKTYKGGFEALKSVQLSIKKGEIFALLGPNGAGKTSLISMICGIITPTSGQCKVGGYNIVKDYRQSRAMIGLVPQELTTDAFESVWNTVSFSRALFGKKPDKAYIERLLKDLSLWDKKDSPIMTLSGGMKRRVLIAKALSHEPDVLFLDEPTTGVDVNLRKDMWEIVRKLQTQGCTIILTTHYIEEAEEMADRIGIINHGELVLVDTKDNLMKRLGTKQLTFELTTPLKTIPPSLATYDLQLSDDHRCLTYSYDTQSKKTGITSLIAELATQNIKFVDLNTVESSLEDIFVNLVEADA